MTQNLKAKAQLLGGNFECQGRLRASPEMGHTYRKTRDVSVTDDQRYIGVVF